MNFDKFIKEYNEIYKAYSRVYHKCAVSLGLSDSAVTILYELRMEKRGISQKDLGVALSLSKQTVNSAIKTLIERNLVEIKESEIDKRTKIIKFTQCGEEFAEKNIDKIIDSERKAFCRLSDAEAKEMILAERKYFEFFLEESSKIKF